MIRKRRGMPIAGSAKSASGRIRLRFSGSEPRKSSDSKSKKSSRSCSSSSRLCKTLLLRERQACISELGRRGRHRTTMGSLRSRSWPGALTTRSSEWQRILALKRLRTLHLSQSRHSLARPKRGKPLQKLDRRLAGRSQALRISETLTVPA